MAGEREELSLLPVLESESAAAINSSYIMAAPQIITLVLLMISTSYCRSIPLRRLQSSFIVMSQNSKRKAPLSSTSAEPSDGQPEPVYRAQGLVAVHKPLTWTSQDVGKNAAYMFHLD